MLSNPQGQKGNVGDPGLPGPQGLRGDVGDRVSVFVLCLPALTSLYPLLHGCQGQYHQLCEEVPLVLLLLILLVFFLGKRGSRTLTALSQAPHAGLEELIIGARVEAATCDSRSQAICWVRAET